MINILPLGVKLPTVVEQTPVDVIFTAQITPSEDSTIELKKIEITDFINNVGITINGDRFSGEYRDSFSLSGDALMYRVKGSEDRLPCASFSELPDPKTVDLYRFIAPDELTRDYTYEVTLTYTETPKAPPAGAQSVSDGVEKEIKKVYTQTVKGNWDLWANELRDFVERGR